MIDHVCTIADEIENRVVAYRRDLHRYAELGWTEFRTASLIARRLLDLGYVVSAGRDVIRAEDRMGVPSEDVLEACWQRAGDEGGDPAFLDVMHGGFTGVVGVLQHGEGPVVGLRFDIDALQVSESRSLDHRPVREGFASLHDGVAHACGHDGHGAVGLGVAEVVSRLRQEIRGTIKLIFQPAEEGVRGAKSMVGAGVVDDVGHLLGHHLYSGWEMGEIAPWTGGYLATTKFDAVFSGLAAHAAGQPQKGKNALLAAAAAVLNLYAIARHRDGSTRINVGRLIAGSGRNVIPADAQLMIETRGTTVELNEYMYDRAMLVLEGAARMYECDLDIRTMGAAQSANGDPEMMAQVEEMAIRLGATTIRPPREGGGSEDFTYMMRRVQERGGLATNIGIGAGIDGWGHHTARFDLDEKAMVRAVKLLAALALTAG